MTGTLLRARDRATGDVTLDADAVVVGTGAGGSIMLRELARAGLSVVAIERGPHSVPSDFNQREERMLPLLYEDGGGRMTSDMAIRILQGRGVGGSTVHNTNLCKRTPSPILELWASRYGVSGASPEAMEPAFATIERELSVTEMGADVRNANNDVLRLGCEALGWKGAPLHHNRKGCVGSGFCELGCAYDAKENALKVVIPQALAAGATVYADATVTRILHEAGQVKGVDAIAEGPDPAVRSRLRVRARVVALAASAVGSAAIARRSGLPDPYGRLGRGLRLHPGAVVAGRFDRPIYGWRGIPQSYECTEHLAWDEGGDKRVWIVPAFAHPIGAAATWRGFGASHMQAMRAYPHLAVLTAMVHDETRGEVSASSDGEPVVSYPMIDSDRAQLAKGLAACARLMLAAGARDVTIPGVAPVRVSSVAELDALDFAFVGPHQVPITSVHPMGTMCMGDDPRTSVVASTGEHHQVRGLFVADGSLFPTSLGGPPQISIYAFALHLSPHAIARARGAL